ncbi:uncharacterized protein [Venturia canescens]|uniref:uncharacterized protein n=1 Tax=Venturia canescens TaxID=32260 RepID=UPI001C9C03AC|nr:uncharacterized protein LOC122406077 [Venturia canescens]
MFKLAIVGLFVAAAMALPASQENHPADLNCLEEDSLFSCLFVKASSALDRAARSSNINLIEGVTFVRDTPLERTAKSLETETEVLNGLPRDASDRTLELVTMLYQSAVSFLKSHSLKINVPEESFSRALVEGRGKIKKVLLPLIAAVGLKIFAVVPIILGGLAILVLKALFVGKIALIIAGILAFQRLFGSGASGVSGGSLGGNFLNKYTQPAASWVDNGAGQGWAAAGAAQTAGQGYYKRSFDDVKNDAQNLAYSSHVPNATD